MAAPGRRLLTAEWRSLVMINYDVPPDVLRPLVPPGVELDLWNGRALASMVGFRFLDTRMLGVAVPFYRHFPEVNLRFYGPAFAAVLHSAPASAFVAAGSRVAVYWGDRLSVVA